MKKFLSQLMATPRYVDALVLGIFAGLITWNPHFADGKINIFEAGLYLPGIQSILNGEVPFRDFFHLRGPFELYMPALLMKMFGVHLKVMYAYFYFGNVLCLILCILIAKELFKTRLLLYLFAPIMIGRAWPRVVFTYWGGMRYALGLLAVWFAVKYFKENRSRWLFYAGITSACALFTSVEMGIYPMLGVLVALAVSKLMGMQDHKLVLKGASTFFGGLIVIGIPFGLYLTVNGALAPYIDGVWTIVTRMQIVIDPHYVSVYPSNLLEALIAMTNPEHTNFKHMTPSYLYIFILIYLAMRIKRKTFSRLDLAVVCLGVYGFIMYNTGFRGLWAAQFEMALQPEKVLYFFLIEVFFLGALGMRHELIPRLKASLASKTFNRDRLKLYACNFFIFAVVGSSIGYPIQRYNHRFFAFKYARDAIMGKDTGHLRPLAGQEARRLTLPRAAGILVPVEQANEMDEIARFVKDRIKDDEALFTYPEMGTYNFLIERRHFGRFPLATFAWFNDRWQEELLEHLDSVRPEYMVVQKVIPQYWKDVYLAPEANRKKHNAVMDFISRNYIVDGQTTLSKIYKINR